MSKMQDNGVPIVREGMRDTSLSCILTAPLLSMTGDNPASTAHSQRDKGARPLVLNIRVMRESRTHGSRRVENQEPECKHYSQQKGRPLVHPPGHNADPCGNESRTCEIRPEQVPGKPGRHEAGDKGENKKMGSAKNYRRNSEEVTTRPAEGEHRSDFRRQRPLWQCRIKADLW
jgi:hypothetical protein